MKATIIAILAAFVLIACEERPLRPDTSASIGNILLANNTIISPKDYSASTQTAMGVIFYANADTVLVVATKELGQYIYADSLGNISNVTNDAITLCGTENTAAILASDFYSPAALAASQYSSPIAGWSLPSAGELRRLSQHLGKVKDAMAVVGGDAFLHEQYLSSSQDGSTSETTQRLYYAVSLENGFVTSVDKMTARNVRPILRIK